MPRVRTGVIRAATSCSAQIALRTVLALSLAGSAGAELTTVDLDPAKTTITFVVGDVLHTVHGTFRLKAGAIQLDAVGQHISGCITVDASSGESRSRARDNRMQHDILEAQRYPEISFTPISIVGLSSEGQVSQATVTGWFAIHGERHQISFPVHIERSGSEISAAGAFVIPYVAWGMKDPSTFILRVNNKVDVTVHAVGHVRPQQGQ